MLYHGGGKGGLTEISPRKSSHGKEYVYATRHRSIALLFLCRWNDFLLTLGTSFKNGRLHITLTERYENALTDIYYGKAGFIYTLDDSGFFSDPDCWELELVSTRPAAPTSCERIDDVYAAIISLAQQGEISLYRYPNRPQSIPKDDSDMVQKALELCKSSGDLYNARYCAERFPHLQQAIAHMLSAELNLQEGLPF